MLSEVPSSVQRDLKPLACTDVWQLWPLAPISLEKLRYVGRSKNNVLNRLILFRRLHFAVATKTKRGTDRQMFNHVAKRQAIARFVENTHVLQPFSTSFHHQEILEESPMRSRMLAP